MNESIKCYFCSLGKLKLNRIHLTGAFFWYFSLYVAPKLEITHTTLKAGVGIFLKMSLSADTNNLNQTKPNQIKIYPGLIGHLPYRVA